MLKACTAGEQVQGDVENMIGFVIGCVQFENGSGGIDVFTQVELLDQLHDDADSAAGDGLLFFCKLKLRGRRSNHWRAKNAFAFINSSAQFLVA